MFMPKVKSGLSLVRPTPKVKLTDEVGELRRPNPKLSMAEVLLTDLRTDWLLSGLRNVNLELLEMVCWNDKLVETR